MPPIKKLIGLTVYPGTCQTSYVEGSYFNPSGVQVYANYSNGTSTQVYTYIYSVASPLTTSSTYVEFIYSEGTIIVSDTLPITVTALRYPTSMQIETTNDFQSIQYYGNNVDLYGLFIHIYYNDSTSMYVDLINCSVTYPSIDQTIQLLNIITMAIN